MKTLMRQPEFILWDRELKRPQIEAIKKYVRTKFGPDVEIDIELISAEEAATLENEMAKFVQLVEAARG